MMLYNKKGLSIYVTHGSSSHFKVITKKYNKLEFQIVVKYQIETNNYVLTNVDTLNGLGLLIPGAALDENEFVTFVNHVKSHQNVDDLNVRLICDANLGISGGHEVTPQLFYLKNGINPQDLALFTETPECVKNAQTTLVGISVTDRRGLDTVIEHQIVTAAARKNSISPLPLSVTRTHGSRSEEGTDNEDNAAKTFQSQSLEHYVTKNKRELSSPQNSNSTSFLSPRNKYRTVMPMPLQQNEDQSLNNSTSAHTHTINAPNSQITNANAKRPVSSQPGAENSSYTAPSDNDATSNMAQACCASFSDMAQACCTPFSDMAQACCASFFPCFFTRPSNSREEMREKSSKSETITSKCSANIS